MIEKTLSRLCDGKTPDEICELNVADIACGSGVFLEEVFQYLQTYCVEWYLENDKSHLIEIDNGGYKLPLEERKSSSAPASTVLILIFTLLKSLSSLCL